MHQCRRPASLLALSLLLPAVAAAQSIADLPLKENRVTVGGYGEVHYTNASGTGAPGRITVKRFVIYLANAFTDRLTLRSEVEWEDAKVEGGKAGGEISVEQLFLDYRFSDAFTLRTGLLLAPIGIVNETLDKYLARYRDDAAAANEVIAVGESTPNETLEPVELAAYTLIANLILNLDETVTRN